MTSLSATDMSVCLIGFDFENGMVHSHEIEEIGRALST